VDWVSGKTDASARQSQLTREASCFCEVKSSSPRSDITLHHPHRHRLARGTTNDTTRAVQFALSTAQAGTLSRRLLYHNYWHAGEHTQLLLLSLSVFLSPFVLCVTSLSAGVLCLLSACLGVASAYRAHLQRPTSSHHSCCPRVCSLTIDYPLTSLVADTASSCYTPSTLRPPKLSAHHSTTRLKLPHYHRPEDQSLSHAPASRSTLSCCNSCPLPSSTTDGHVDLHPSTWTSRLYTTYLLETS
jgi:hypothetical protein